MLSRVVRLRTTSKVVRIRKLPTCAKLAEVFGEILHQKVFLDIFEMRMTLLIILGRPTYGV